MARNRVVVFIVIGHVDVGKAGIVLSWPPHALLDLSFCADYGLGAIGEADPRAAICAWKNVGLGDKRAELRWATTVGADWRAKGQ